MHTVASVPQHQTRSVVGADTLRTLALAAAAFLLQACGATGPSWVETPLIADAHHTSTGEYEPHAAELVVAAQTQVHLKFDYGTLPKGQLPQLVIANQTATVSQMDYSLTADKIVRARLVLYVDSVTAPGYIEILGAHTPQGDCFPREDTPPNCSEFLGSAPAAATDADQPTVPLRITARGFYSFDVTELVKHRLAGNRETMLVVRAARDPDDASFGSFTLASKEQQVGQPYVLHQPQLFVTLDDAIGISSNAAAATSVRWSASDPSLATQNFRLDENLWLDGGTDERAYALVQPVPLAMSGTTLRTFLNQLGTKAYKQSMVASVNAPVPRSAGMPPHIAWSRRARFSTTITWSSGWSEPPASDLFTSVPLDPGARNQVVLAQTSTPYVDALAQGYAANANESFAMAGTTNRPGTVTLDSDDDRRTGHAPRFVSVITPAPAPASLPFVFDAGDSTLAFRYCLFVSNTTASCGAPLQLRARLGQRFTTGAIVIDPRGLTDGTDAPFRTPINIAVPASGPSADITTDPDPDNQSLAAGLSDGLGYYIHDARANRAVGTYEGLISMPGHNVRATIQFENLPLPVPSLDGPATIDIPPSASSVTVPVDAPQPFALDVDDAIVNAHIDDTTKWRITSSQPADTMPAELQQTDGRVNFAVTFASAGARTLTATSIGDGTLTATLGVEVRAQSTTALTLPASRHVFGQPAALTATVRAGGQPPAGVVTWLHDSQTIGSASLANGVAGLSALLPAGTHTIRARYHGDEANRVLGSTSAPGTLVISRAATLLGMTAPAAITLGETVSLTTMLSVVAPGAGNPGGTMTISDGAGASCSYAVPSSNGCTLTPTSAGIRNLVATYSGDASFSGSSGTAALAVNRRSQVITFGPQTPPSHDFVANAAFALNPEASASSGLPVHHGSATPETCTVAGVVVTMRAVGTCTITADQSGDASYAEASQVRRHIGIGLGVASVSLSASTTNTAVGHPVTFVAVVQGQAPGGVVTFTDGTNALCAAVPLSTDENTATARCDVASLDAGMHAVAARYSGDTSNAAQDSAPVMLSVLLNAATMRLATTPNPAPLQQPVTLLAVVGGAPPAPAPTGEVTFYDGTTRLGSVTVASDGRAILVLPALGLGSHSLRAEYPGDRAYAPATAWAESRGISTEPVPALSSWLLALLGAALAIVGVGAAKGRRRRA
jgi:hypothetical protein